LGLLVWTSILTREKNLWSAATVQVYSVGWSRLRRGGKKGRREKKNPRQQTYTQKNPKETPPNKESGNCQNAATLQRS
jgi:hypothetical protein